VSLLRYAVVTAARDEAERLPRLAESLRSQTVQPAAWVIVDNGSTDRTGDVAAGLAGRDGRIRCVAIPASPGEHPAGHGHVRGGPVTRAFHAGLEALGELPEVVVKVDADVTFEPTYFERLLAVFAQEPELGIASGVCHELDAGGWRPRYATGETAWGAARAYRRDCLLDVLPLEERMGWDGIDSLKAGLRGWRTRTLPELTFRHHRGEGQRDGAPRRAWSARGRAAHFMGYRPWYVVLRALHHARSDRAAAAMVLGYAAAALRREDRCADTAVRAELRRSQSVRELPARLREARGR
jgi:glycosyltransferase involved in cell wall biosynthesis